MNSLFAFRTATGFRSQTYNVLRAFSLFARVAKPPNLPPRMKIPEEDIEESFLKGTGPGGQKINKTNSAVQLKHVPTGIVVKCQQTRSRAQNRKVARRQLVDKLDEMQNGDKSRLALKAQDKLKKKASKTKKAHRKYRKLEVAKKAAPGEVEPPEAEDGVDEALVAEDSDRSQSAGGDKSSSRGQSG